MAAARKSPRAPKAYTGDWGNEPIRLDIERRIATSRPFPPDGLGEEDLQRFEPSIELAEWIRGTFINASGPLANEKHAHLIDANIGALWTNAINVSKMRHVLATAEIPQTMGSAWKRGRGEQQLRDWFGVAPDFLLTFYAPECSALDDRPFCGLVEHELLHCAHAKDRYGSPKFDRVTGRPIFAIQGHDVEVFFDEIERYGPTPEVARLLAIAKRAPIIGDGPISIACGTCAALRAA